MGNNLDEEETEYLVADMVDDSQYYLTGSNADAATIELNGNGSQFDVPTHECFSNGTLLVPIPVGGNQTIDHASQVRDYGCTISQLQRFFTCTECCSQFGLFDFLTIQRLLHMYIHFTHDQMIFKRTL